MTNVRTRMLRTVLLTGTLMASSAAIAQTEPEAGAANGSDNEIVVTAQKRNERLQDVPMAVTAVSSDKLIESHQVRLQDYFTKVPGLNIQAQGNGQANIAIRGIITGSATNPVVGIVIDDVPYGPSTATAYGSQLFPDLDPSVLNQVEVLRGPQGTLYGASSLGGLIKFVTREPSFDKVSGHGEINGNNVAHGNFGVGLRASVNLPLGDKAAVLASGFIRKDAGFIDNVNTRQDNLDETKVKGAHVALLVRPLEAVTVKLAALLQDFKGYGTSEVDTNSAFVPTFGLYRQFRVPDTGRYDIRSRLYSATIAVDLGAAELKSITGYGVNTYTELADLSGSFGLYSTGGGATLANDFITKRLTQEVRLSSTGKNTIDWIVGGFYNRERSVGLQKVTSINAVTGAITPDVIASALDGNLLTIDGRPHLSEVAGFVDATVHFGEQFDIQVGGRYSESRQSYQQFNTGVVAGPNALVRSSDNAFTYLVSPRFHFSRDLMAYARVSSGYRVGGPNSAAAFSAVVPTEFKPDRTTNYEIGLKGTILDRALSFDISAYHIIWKDIQLAFNDPVNGFTFFTNGAKAKSTGVEGNFSARLAPGLTISGNATYSDARLSEALSAGFGVGAKDERLPFSSRFAGTLAADYETPVSASVDAFFGASVTHVGARLGGLRATTNDLRLTFPAYTTGDLRVGIKGDDWRISLFANNVTDERGIASAASRGLTATAADPYSVTYIRPRTIGASISRDF